MGKLQKILNIFSYHEPKDKERGFELLEGEGEKGTDPDKQESGKQKQKDNNEDKLPSISEAIHQETHKSSTNSSQVESPITGDLNDDINYIKGQFNLPDNKDIIIREFKIGRKIGAFIVYVEGMVDKKTINESLLRSLMDKDVITEKITENIPDYLIENILTINLVKKGNNYSSAVKEILNGASALFIDDCTECILIETKGYEKRNVDKPMTETVVRGPQQGFTESLRTNITLIRRIVRNQGLITEIQSVGDSNNSDCALLYLKDVANPRVIAEVKKRIQSISTDFILDSGMLEQFISDHPYMVLPQVISTERPDRSASFIMEGQVVLLVEGSPFALAVPVTFFRLFHTSEDSFVSWPLGTFLRIIRLLGFIFASLLPGLYISVILFHPEMLPTELLASIAKSKETVPFPSVLELLILEISFELIREGGIRVPSIIGQTLGIVGALILGQAAVSAGLVTPVLVIIVAVTGLGSFVIPNYNLAIGVRIVRFMFIAAGALLGFYGISLLLFILGCYSCSMKSFGVPFFSPIAPKTKVNHDLLIRVPIWMQKQRADYLDPPNRKKQGDNKKVWIKKDGSKN